MVIAIWIEFDWIVAQIWSLNIKPVIVDLGPEMKSKFLL